MQKNEKSQMMVFSATGGSPDPRIGVQAMVISSHTTGVDELQALPLRRVRTEQFPGDAGLYALIISPKIT